MKMLCLIFKCWQLVSGVCVCVAGGQKNRRLWVRTSLAAASVQSLDNYSHNCLVSLIVAAVLSDKGLP